MKEVVMHFSDEEYAKLLPQCDMYQTVEELLFECLIGILPFLAPRPWLHVPEDDDYDDDEIC